MAGVAACLINIRSRDQEVFKDISWSGRVQIHSLVFVVLNHLQPADLKMHKIINVIINYLTHNSKHLEHKGINDYYGVSQIA